MMRSMPAWAREGSRRCRIAQMGTGESIGAGGNRRLALLPSETNRPIS